jgi:hypothetical protein
MAAESLPVFPQLNRFDTDESSGSALAFWVRKDADGIGREWPVCVEAPNSVLSPTYCADELLILSDKSREAHCLGFNAFFGQEFCTENVDAGPHAGLEGNLCEASKIQTSDSGWAGPILEARHRPDIRSDQL